MKYWDIQDKAEEGTFVTFESHREAQNWLDRETARYPERVNRNGMHIVERERQTLSEKCVELEHTIEALQQENEKQKQLNVAMERSMQYWLQNNPHGKLTQDNVRLQQENEQLKNDNINSEMNLAHMTDLHEQLQAQNGAMVEALKQAREALALVSSITAIKKLNISNQAVQVAIKATDKVVEK